MARMLGVCRREWCPHCRSRGYGMDCPSTARGKKAERQREAVAGAKFKLTPDYVVTRSRGAAFWAAIPGVFTRRLSQF